MVGKDFPSVYFEHPLAGMPFLDVIVLLNDIAPGTRVELPVAGEHAAMLDWYASVRQEHDDICCGFELDTKETALPTAAIHFQPRSRTELVRPFCEIVGEPERATLYLDMAARMPGSWPLSFFGMFRGREAAPLRVCGYLSAQQKHICARNPSRLAKVFDTVGFTAYDRAMLEQISTLMAAAPEGVDFQFDVYPDGSLGDTFAIDVQFGIEQPEAVFASFTNGPGSGVMGLFESWGVADSRWRLSVQSAFARAIPVELEDGSLGKFAFTLMPQWAKARWIRGALQPAKLYHLAHAGLL